MDQPYREFLDALRRRDLEAAGAFLHEDFLITTAGWLAEPASKQTWLDSWSDRMSLDSYDFPVVATQRFDGVEVVLAESAQSGTHDGSPFSLTFRYTDVWVRGESGWTLATRHASIVPVT
jgi:ketosteroid isomerase-like protein